MIVPDWSDCRATCPTGSNPIFYSHGSTECLLKLECTAKGKYTKTTSTSSTCIAEAECIADTSYFKDVSEKNCVTACPTGEFKDIEDKECRSKAECTIQGKYTRADTSQCLTRDQCIGSSGFMTIESSKLCVNSCPSSLYKETILKKCLTKSECRNLNPPQYSLNATSPECITA